MMYCRSLGFIPAWASRVQKVCRMVWGVMFGRASSDLWCLLYFLTSPWNIEQEDRLLAFAGSDPVYRKYCDEIIILLGTGLRVSELCGLTTDLDFESRCIHVDHQLLRDSELGYYVDEPKTKKGARQIPMSEKVYQALKRAVKNRGKAAPVNIGGYTNFLFLNQSGLPKTASCYESMVSAAFSSVSSSRTSAMAKLNGFLRMQSSSIAV